VNARGIAFVVWVAAVSVGCGSRSESPSAAIELRVVAEPRAGVHEVSAYDPPSVRAAAAGQFEHVDYSFLPNIIVWLVPATETTGAPPAALTIELDPAKPAEEITPASVGQKLVLHNAAQKALSVYSVSDGNEFELNIAPGATGETVARGEGLIELLADPAQPPIAQIYVAPTRWVARAHSGEKVTFDHLPPGKYQAGSWHSRLPGSTISIDAIGGSTAHGTIKVGVNNLQPTSSP
jgi:hypothetical protein